MHYWVRSLGLIWCKLTICWHLVPSDLSHEVLGCQFEFKITGNTTISTMMIPALGFHSILTALVIARYTRDVLELYKLFGQWRVTGLLLVILRDAFVDFISLVLRTVHVDSLITAIICRILTTAAVNVVIMYIHTKNVCIPLRNERFADFVCSI